MTFEGRRFGVRLQPPRMGEHTRELLEELGLAGSDIDDLRAQGIVG
jgi:crotonobetainyl-CoA:carnitine CoA-transferase CaiB-like acyl-CoA transferase